MLGRRRFHFLLPALAASGATVPSHLLDVDRQNWSYYLNLLTPVESRWKYRVIPGMAVGYLPSGPGLTGASTSNPYRGSAKVSSDFMA